MDAARVGLDGMYGMGPARVLRPAGMGEVGGVWVAGAGWVWDMYRTVHACMGRTLITLHCE